jgi:opacity protein-like surface antigen
MKTFRILTAVVAVAGLLVTQSRGATQEATFYFKGDAGATWVMDTDLKDFIGLETAGARVEFDPGARVGLGFGYNVTEWFAAEAELGFMANSIKNISDADRVDAVLGQAPFMINARLQLPTTCGFTSYIGAGGGGSAMYLDIDEMEIGGLGVRGTGSGVVWAYQAFAGVRYDISQTIGLSLEYRYFGTGAPEFKGDNHHHFDDSESIRFGRIEGHAVSIAVQFRL